jgi:hypothetical protein
VVSYTDTIVCGGAFGLLENAKPELSHGVEGVRGASVRTNVHNVDPAPVRYVSITRADIEWKEIDREQTRTMAREKDTGTDGDSVETAVRKYTSTHAHIIRYAREKPRTTTEDCIE